MTTAPRTLKMTGIECSGNDGFTQPTAACAQSISAIQTSKRNEKPISEDKHNDQFFNPFVSTCKLTDQNQHENYHAAELDRNAEQHLERNRTAEDLRHCGRHPLPSSPSQESCFQPRRQIEARRLREALSRDNAEMRRIVLQKNPA